VIIQNALRFNPTEKTTLKKTGHQTRSHTIITKNKNIIIENTVFMAVTF
jgi:hypothetical protein